MATVEVTKLTAYAVTPPALPPRVEIAALAGSYVPGTIPAAVEVTKLSVIYVASMPAPLAAYVEITRALGLYIPIWVDAARPHKVWTGAAWDWAARKSWDGTRWRPDATDSDSTGLYVPPSAGTFGAGTFGSGIFGD